MERFLRRSSRWSLFAIAIMLGVRECFVFAYAIETEPKEGFLVLSIAGVAEGAPSPQEAVKANGE